MGRVMALDVGTKTIGIAISDPLRIAAHPDRTLKREGVARDVDRIAKIAAERSVDHVVVGLPYELDGTEGRSARLARQIGDAVAAGGLPVTYIDERFTSVEANRQLIEADLSRERRKAVIDQAAAALILQSFLDHGDWTRDPASRPPK
jgi:putative Holliday junction resolvase